MLMMTQQHGRRLSPEIFRQLRDIIYEQSGIFFPENKLYLLEGRLKIRLTELGLESFQQYVHYLGNATTQPEELKSIYNLVTINETYFFRYHKQLEAFSRSLLPALLQERVQQPQRSLRIWSAAVASGEELYTLAMLLREHLGSGLDQWDIQLLGTDISKRILAKARSGEYGANSFRGPEFPDLKARYFTRQGDIHRVNNDLRAMVAFDYLNLNDVPAIKQLGKVDFIFCRNVLIYFDQDMKKRVIGAFYDILNPGGHLLLGEAESLHGVSSAFKIEHYPGAFAYRKA